jgi:hypothetical protein
MYSPAAMARRRCLALRKDGLPCQAWARWADPAQRCAAHSVHHTGPIPKHDRSIPWVFPPARYIPCTCRAYPFPHRPGGGRCQWPETIAW